MLGLGKIEHLTKIKKHYFNMKLIRVKKDINFTTINNEFIFNKNLSLKAKGLLCHILALPNEWTLYIEEVSKWHKDGKSAVYAAFKELSDNGYMTRSQSREKGRFGGYQYTIYEKPHTEKPNTEKPHTEKPHTENQSLLNTNSSNNLIKLNTNKSKTKSFRVPDELNIEAWKLWKQFKKEQFKTSYKNIGELAAINKLIKISGGCFDTQFKIINQSIENGWKGLFELKEKAATKSESIISEYQKGINLINKQYE
jgi:predicted transcriptional regulator